MGLGYDIGVSGSQSIATSVPQVADAGTVFNFNSAGASGDYYGESVAANPVADASASAKSPGSDQGLTLTQAAQASPSSPGLFGLSTTQLLIGGGILAILGVGIVVYLVVKKKV